MRNSQALIKYAIDSIVSQDFPHELMKVIFVDDGSEDKTLSIIESYVSKMDIQAKVFSGEWRGLGAARSTVVNNAEGDYIVWVDDDIILSKDNVRKQVEFMEHNPNVGIGYGNLGILPGQSIVLALDLIPRMVDYLQKSTWKTNEKLPGTCAAIYRIKAIRQVGGFNKNIRGSGEDQDAAYRVKAAGWLICQTNSVFYETHRRMTTWIDLWRKYFWHGSTERHSYPRNKHLFSLPRMVPPAGFIAGFLYSIKAYRILHRKIVFLLPLHFAFRVTAWCLGFLLSKPRA